MRVELMARKPLTPFDDPELERARDEARFKHFIPTWLVPHLSKDESVLSVGCGSGRDVEMLRALGYRAYGFDPGRTVFFKERPPEIQQYLSAGRPGDKPFGDQRFDKIYALEVIEHVGCFNGGTSVEEDFVSQRDEFMRDSLSLLKPGGSFLITSSNKLCPIDVGHSHRYHAVGRLANELLDIGLTWPFHPKNPLWSVGDVRRSLERIGVAEYCSVELLSVANYPRVSAKASLKGRIANIGLKAVSLPGILGGPLCPILAVEVKTRSDIPC